MRLLPRPAGAHRSGKRLRLVWSRVLRGVRSGANIAAVGVLVLLCYGCSDKAPPALDALPLVTVAGAAAPRISGAVLGREPRPAALVALGRPNGPSGPAPSAPPGPAAEAGTVSLDFVDADLREIAAQVLGTVLRVNYSIDPKVRGTATLRTVVPVSRNAVLPALEALLSQNGAVLTQAGRLYQVVPMAALTGTAGFDAAPADSVVFLRYASAARLEQVLQPYASVGARVVAAPDQNALLVSSDPVTRRTLLSLIEAFDVDLLAGQSYALFPATSGTPQTIAQALTVALRADKDATLAGQVRVVPMERIGAVLVVSGQPRAINEARRVYDLLERSQWQSVRSWAVYYLQNSRGDDVAAALQRAFTPGRVTAGSGSGGRVGSLAPGRAALRTGTAPGAGDGGPAPSPARPANADALPAPTSTPPTSTPPSSTLPPASPLSGAGNPPPGGPEPAAGGGDSGRPSAEEDRALRIIAVPQSNAIMVYATPQERGVVEAMLRKIDVVPLQVRLDATIAEVTLNDNLSYGTQFALEANGLTAALSRGQTAGGFASGFPGFVLSGPNNANGALAALQAVTTVRVLSSPQLLVVDNQPARLQVGNSVPTLSAASQSSLVANATIVNSVEYHDTGVLLEILPQINSGGLVTLDISQEVSDVVPGASANDIASPTFSQRAVTSRVAVQDGQTVGLAGVIRDSVSRDNNGIPLLREVPLLGVLAGTQANVRSRTELLVLITPHVVRVQNEARDLTNDLRDQLSNAARLPQDLRSVHPGGLPDPGAPLRRGL